MWKYAPVAETQTMSHVVKSRLLKLPLSWMAVCPDFTLNLGR